MPLQVLQAEECLKMARKILSEMSQSLSTPKTHDWGDQENQSPIGKVSPLLIINYDKIRSLRQQNRHKEAEELILAHNKRMQIYRASEKRISAIESKKKYSEFLRQERLLKSEVGLCSHSGCFNEKKLGFANCERCIQTREKSRGKINGLQS